jgi:hypothetical protein
MSARQTLAILIGVLGIGFLLYGKPSHIGLAKKCKACDLIALVEITETHSSDIFELTGTHSTNGSDVFLTNPWPAVAEAKIVEIVKGEIKQGTIQIDYNKWWSCPGVRYSAGEKCLVFATRLTNGHFATYNPPYGKLAVTNDEVLGWYSETKKNTRGARVKVEAVKKEIRALTE